MDRLIDWCWVRKKLVITNSWIRFGTWQDQYFFLTKKFRVIEFRLLMYEFGTSNPRVTGQSKCT